MAAPGLENTLALQAPPRSFRLEARRKSCGWDPWPPTVTPPFLSNCRSHPRLPAPGAWAATSASLPASFMTFDLQSRESQSPA